MAGDAMHLIVPSEYSGNKNFPPAHQTMDL